MFKTNDNLKMTISKQNLRHLNLVIIYLICLKVHKNYCKNLSTKIKILFKVGKQQNPHSLAAVLFNVVCVLIRWTLDNPSFYVSHPSKHIGPPFFFLLITIMLINTYVNQKFIIGFIIELHLYFLLFKSSLFFLPVGTCYKNRHE